MSPDEGNWKVTLIAFLFAMILTVIGLLSGWGLSKIGFIKEKFSIKGNPCEYTTIQK